MRIGVRQAVRPVIDHVPGAPTMSDERKVLRVKVGEYIVTTRRSGHAWHIGGLTS